MLKEADTHERDKKYNLAITSLNKAKVIHGADKQAIEKRIKAIQQKAGAGTLFGTEPDQENDDLS